MKASLSTYWRGLASGKGATLADRLALALLIPLSLPYSLIQRLRAGLYRCGVLQSRKLPCPVISIGNITVGGTGKTPVTALIGRLLLSQGFKVAVLSRGYGGSCEGQTAIASDGKTILLSAEECGDEPFLLASTLPGLMVVIGSNRHAAGLLAMERLQPDIFLLDDGFQHLPLQRDLNILLLDAQNPFGNGWCLPAGLLREPRLASLRADWIIHTRCQSTIMNIPGLEHIPQISARHDLADLLPLSGGTPFPFDSLAGCKVIAFAGIAEPESFFDGLRMRGLQLVATRSLPDHAAYPPALTDWIEETLQRHAADYAVTTEKDGVKLKQLPAALARKTLLARLNLTLDDPTPLTAALRNLLQK